jgi:xanthine/CO dehydrogenase XdhC/CoxF family maturation factor
VPEIAISIVAELIARRNVGERRAGGARQREMPARVDASAGGAA